MYWFFTKLLPDVFAGQACRNQFIKVSISNLTNYSSRDSHLLVNRIYSSVSLLWIVRYRIIRLIYEERRQVFLWMVGSHCYHHHVHYRECGAFCHRVKTIDGAIPHWQR